MRKGFVFLFFLCLSLSGLSAKASLRAADEALSSFRQNDQAFSAPAQRNMEIFLKALRGSPGGSISFSKEEIADMALYGRDENGGNTLHAIAESLYIDPQIAAYFASKLPSKAIRKALAEKNHEGLIPEDLAKRKSNYAALALFDILKEKHNKALGYKAWAVLSGASAAGLSAMVYAAYSMSALELAISAALTGGAAAASAACLNAFMEHKALH